jgi:hypothetical protein
MQVSLTLGRGAEYRVSPNLLGIWRGASFRYVRCPQGVNAPAFGLAACHQGTNADDLVKGVLGKAFAKRLPDSRFGGHAKVEHPSGRREVGNRFQVPDDD